MEGKAATCEVDSRTRPGGDEVRAQPVIFHFGTSSTSATELIPMVRALLPEANLWGRIHLSLPAKEAFLGLTLDTNQEAGLHLDMLAESELAAAGHFLAPVLSEGTPFISHIRSRTAYEHRKGQYLKLPGPLSSIN